MEEELTRGPRFTGADQSENLGAAVGDDARSARRTTAVRVTRVNTMSWLLVRRREDRHGRVKDAYL
jgi:hypothetical protein